MVEIGDMYTSFVPMTDLNVAGLEYYIEATDGANTITSPEDIQHHMRL